MDYELLMMESRKKIGCIAYGNIFVVKDLFDGAEWNAIPKGNRIAFGKYFKNEVLDGKIPEIMYHCKAKNNSAQYKKIEITEEQHI